MTTENPDQPVELPVVDAAGPPETAEHPLVVDDAEAQRGRAVWQAVDDLDDHSDGISALGGVL